MSAEIGVVIREALDAKFTTRSVRALSANDIGARVAFEHRDGPGQVLTFVVGDLRQIYHNSSETHLELVGTDQDQGDLTTYELGTQAMVWIG